MVYEDGQTTLDKDEKEGLLIPLVTIKVELDEVEQRNIEAAILWVVARRRKFTVDEVLTEGSFRNPNKNKRIDYGLTYS